MPGTWRAGSAPSQSSTSSTGVRPRAVERRDGLVEVDAQEVPADDGPVGVVVDAGARSAP